MNGEWASSSPDERGRELIAAPGDGGDRVRAEQPAQRADLHLQVVFLDHEAGPDQVQQLGLGHDPVAAFGQRQEHVECASAHRHRVAVLQQSAVPGLQLKAAEFQRHGTIHGPHLRPRRRLGLLAFATPASVYLNVGPIEHDRDVMPGPTG